MAITEREKVIAVLQKERKTALHDNVWAFDYAISSLKTDEAYQLMYEGEDIYTKADMVAMLTELQTEIEEIEMGNNVPFGFKPVNKFYEGVSASSKVIQQKIDALRGNNENSN